MGCLANSTAICLFLKSRKVNDDSSDENFDSDDDEEEDEDEEDDDDDLYIIGAVCQSVSQSVNQKSNYFRIRGVWSFLMFL